MPKEVIMYDRVKVFFRDVTYLNKVYVLVAVCPLCNKKISNGEKLYSIINNYKLFPNLYVHKACVPSKRGCVIRLVKMYEEFKKFKIKYKFWLDKPQV